MHRHCGTNNRAPLWAFTGPCKPEVRPGAREEPASPARLAAPAMNVCDTTKVYIHGEEHVKKLFSTAVIVNEGTHWTFVRGH